MEILDILTASPFNSGGGGPYNWYSFTVDNTLEEVPVVNTDGNFIDLLSSHSNLNGFQAGDNLQLLSFGVDLPAGYNFASIKLAPTPTPDAQRRQRGIEVNIRDIAAIPTTVRNRYQLFSENYEIALDQFVSYSKSNFSGPIVIGMQFIEGVDQSFPFVDMRGVPDSENGKTYVIKPYLKVLHSLEMIQVV